MCTGGGGLKYHTLKVNQEIPLPFKEPKGSFNSSHKPAPNPCSESDEFSPHHDTLLLSDLF
jgi:hypothetical protein